MPAHQQREQQAEAVEAEGERDPERGDPVIADHGRAAGEHLWQPTRVAGEGGERDQRQQPPSGATRAPPHRRRYERTREPGEHATQHHDRSSLSRVGGLPATPRGLRRRHAVRGRRAVYNAAAHDSRLRGAVARHVGVPRLRAAVRGHGLRSPVTEDLLLLTAATSCRPASSRGRCPAAVLRLRAGERPDDLQLRPAPAHPFAHPRRAGAAPGAPAHLRVATRWFSRFGDRIVFFARLLPGTRLLVFLTAGVRAMPGAASC